MSPTDQFESAETRFRAAFERLKVNKPIVLKKGAFPSQNNIAKEAGCDTTALRKSRYPKFISEIQAWGKAHAGDGQPSPESRVEAARRKSRAIAAAMEVMQLRFDVIASELLAARTKILELHQNVERLQAQLGMGNVIAMPSTWR